MTPRAEIRRLGLVEGNKRENVHEREERDAEIQQSALTSRVPFAVERSVSLGISYTIPMHSPKCDVR